MDNFYTGSHANIMHWMGHPNFQLLMHDVTEPLRMEVDQIYHLACPASPPHYQVLHDVDCFPRVIMQEQRDDRLSAGSQLVLIFVQQTSGDLSLSSLQTSLGDLCER